MDKPSDAPRAGKAAGMNDGFRRIVTGHDGDGNARLVSDALPVRVIQVGGDAGATFYEVWHTLETPALIDRQSDEPMEDGLILAPPAGGTRIRVIDFPPEGDNIRQLSEAGAREAFDAMRGGAASRFQPGGTHPLMHRTQSVDYGIVLDGEMTLLLDNAETMIRTGDIVVQRGTNHAWSNRSGRRCRMAFVLIDGQFTDGL
jgi:mannose-6-phosphate isomerase-like protein (cupin superfamily)